VGSVKDPIMDDSPVGRLYIPAQPHTLGRVAWKVSGRSSVLDLKELIPPVEIPNKGEILAMMTGTYFEHAAENRMPSSYLGMVDREGAIVSARSLLDLGEVSDIVVMELGNVPTAKTEAGIREYHRAIADGDLTVYVADAESIFRRGFPLGSSTFKNIFKHTRREKQYEGLSTYEETVAALDEIRAEVGRRGLDTFPELQAYLKKMKLGTTIPNPGHRYSQFGLFHI